MNANGSADKFWDAAAADNAHSVYRQAGNLSHMQLARNRLSQAVAIAVERIIHISRNSTDEALAFKASQYITDRVLGPTNQAGKTADDPLQSLRSVIEGAVVGDNN